MASPSTFLAFDVGNSAAKAGLFVDGHLQHTFSLTHTRGVLAPGAHGQLQATLHGLRLGRVGIVSVVPAVTAALRSLLAQQALPAPQVVTTDTPLPFALAYATPDTLGKDRLAAAAAAWVLYRPGPGAGVVALDAGTAVTHEVISPTGTYLGGPIAPGPALLRDALHRGTAQLPQVPLTLPETPVARSTQEALQAGIMFGFIDAVRGMLQRIEAQVGWKPHVVATGGWGPFLASHIASIALHDPHLVLKGVHVLLNPAVPMR